MVFINNREIVRRKNKLLFIYIYFNETIKKIYYYIYNNKIEEKKKTNRTKQTVNACIRIY